MSTDQITYKSLNIQVNMNSIIIIYIIIALSKDFKLLIFIHSLP